MSLISQTKSALWCSEIRSKQIPDLAFYISPLHQYRATSRPALHYYITTESWTTDTKESQNHASWTSTSTTLLFVAFTTYINTISVILTLCYFYKNTKETRYVFSTTGRVWKGEHWWGESDARGKKTMVKGEIFFIFFKEIEYHDEAETVIRGEFVELSFKT